MQGEKSQHPQWVSLVSWGPLPCSLAPDTSPGLQHGAAQPAGPGSWHHLQPKVDLALYLLIRIDLRQVGPPTETCEDAGEPAAWLFLPPSATPGTMWPLLNPLKVPVRHGLLSPVTDRWAN